MAKTRPRSLDQLGVIDIHACSRSQLGLRLMNCRCAWKRWKTEHVRLMLAVTSRGVMPGSGFDSKGAG